MAPYRTLEKEYSNEKENPLAEQQTLSFPGPAELPEQTRHKKVHLQLKAVSRWRQRAQKITEPKQRVVRSEELMQQITQLIGDPSLDISLRDIHRNLELLVEEKKFRKKHQAHFSRLTPREKEVLLKLAQGFTSPKIATQLSISLETVKHHRKIIRGKLEAKSIADFVRYAQAFNLKELLDE